MKRLVSTPKILVAVLLVSFFLTSRAPTYSTQEPRATAQIRIELQPLDTLSKPGEEPYVLGQKVRLRMVAKNESDQRILVRAVNPYYQNRPRLYKEGNLIPYRSQIAKLVSSKDSDPEFVSSGDFIFVEPYSSANLRQLNLDDWYGPLEPGSYRLINRYRFHVGGPWSADSKPVSFKVVPGP